MADTASFIISLLKGSTTLPCPVSKVEEFALNCLQGIIEGNLPWAGLVTNPDMQIHLQAEVWELAQEALGIPAPLEGAARAA